MAKTSKLISLIKEIVRQEVQKEVREIFIKEGMKSMTQQSTLVEDKVVEVLPKRKPKPKEKVTYTKNPVLNDILNETANAGEMDEYPTMGGGTFDSSRMNDVVGKSYGDMMNDTSQPNANIAREMGVDPNDPANSFLTKDYRKVMKAIDNKKTR